MNTPAPAAPPPAPDSTTARERLLAAFADTPEPIRERIAAVLSQVLSEVDDV